MPAVPSSGAFFGQVLPDGYTLFFNTLFLIAALATTILSLAYWDALQERGEYYILLLLSVIGMSLMASAHDLLIFFVGLETMSISIYVLVGSERKNVRSNEAAIKYLLLGAFASALLLYGVALLYGMTGSIGYRDMALGVGNILLTGDATSKAVLMVGVSLLLVGLFFKVAAVAREQGLKSLVKRVIGRSLRGYEDNLRREQFNHLLRAEYGPAGLVFDLARGSSPPNPTAVACRTASRGRSTLPWCPSTRSDGGHLNETGRRYVAGQLLVFLASQNTSRTMKQADADSPARP